ncbi:hypothetical protein JHK82_035446 [Glycine max]|nr:hypothetical protein JHK86_035575 [Glycine max]KAG5112177.1 hypothetical protein JHK82_035446 [Glycine max]
MDKTKRVEKVLNQRLIIAHTQGIYIDEGKTEREKKNKKKLERYQTFSYKQAQHEDNKTKCDALTW